MIDETKMEQVRQAMIDILGDDAKLVLAVITNERSRGHGESEVQVYLSELNMSPVYMASVVKSMFNRHPEVALLVAKLLSSELETGLETGYPINIDHINRREN